MKTRILSLCHILLLIACSKSADPVAKACKFTFKGTSFTLTLATCEVVASENYMYGQDVADNPTQTLTITKGTNVAVDQVEFVGNVSDLDTYYSTIKNASSPSITISGKAWTFSGTVENTIGDKGEISGTCTCK